VPARVTSKSEDSQAGASPRSVGGLHPQAKGPFALIASAQDSPRELETLLRWHGPVAHFPSLSHFCTDESGAERWAGVVVARACAWDARLDRYVSDRSRLALFGRALERQWPAGVRRLSGIEAAEAWLGELSHSSKISSVHERPVGANAHSKVGKAGSAPPRSPATTVRMGSTRGSHALLHGRGEYLVVGASEESTLSLLTTLRRSRPARHAQTLAELAPELRQARPWTGVLALHEHDASVTDLLRDKELLGVWRASPHGVLPVTGRLLEDEPSLLAWMAQTLAFEHTGSLPIARAVEHMAIEYGLFPQHAEVLAVATCTSELEERAERLSMSLPDARAALKALCDTARGVPVQHLVARVREHAS
jgi:hypothetical protein